MQLHSTGGVDDGRLLRWTDERGEPLPVSAEPSASVPPAAAGVAYPIALEGVGRVYLWAELTTGRTSTPLEQRFAAHYLRAANALIKRYGARGVAMEAAQAHWQVAQAHQSAQQWQASLAASVLAAEQSVIALARARLQRLNGRLAFLWGVHTADASAAEISLSRLTPPLNCLHSWLTGADTSWERAFGQAQSQRLALSAAVCPSAKGRVAPCEALGEALNTYRGRVRYWTVTTDVQELTVEPQVIDALAELSVAARAADGGIVRALHGRFSWYANCSPYPLLERCVDAGVPFETIQLEWHWYDGTLYDFDELLERFGELGKPIYLLLAPPPTSGWNDFSRATPEAWTEAASVIALSKPFVSALYVPLTAGESWAGALDADGSVGSAWRAIARVVEWNRALLRE
ncbi:MAG: hypothetical protein NZ550_01345 [Fimbriimonadales bacterium]|nr:hypothetical protein [Fimbriimonadales bacterium]MDW8052123.1 hypothetical protein [Armatimonadota bacterium]